MDDEFECPMCFDTVPRTDVLSLCSDHAFCSDCSWRCCESALREGLVPSCPLRTKETRCGAIEKSLAVAAHIRASASASFSRTRLDEVYLSAERARMGAVQCIACPKWHVPRIPHSTAPQRIQCSCGADFCAACRQPYHFRSSCAEALRLQARWVRFLQEELPAFLMAAVRVDGERWAPVLEAHAAAKGALNDTTRDALSRFDELRRMELWKQKHCKRCPHCRSVVEKMEGCDMMTCGNDAHGGNQQRGCGQPFVWSVGQPNSALEYEADLRGAADYAAEDATDAGDGDKEDGAMRERRLQRDAREEHQRLPGEPLLCDGCATHIIGPRLTCMLCEISVDLCVACIARDGGGPKRLRLRDGRRHHKGHIFRRTRQQLMMSYGHCSAASSGDRGGAAAAPEMEEEGLQELTASSVAMRPGLTTAAAAAARAAEMRATNARVASMANGGGGDGDGHGRSGVPVPIPAPAAAPRRNRKRAVPTSEHGRATGASHRGAAAPAAAAASSRSSGMAREAEKVVIELLDSDDD